MFPKAGTADVLHHHLLGIASAVLLFPTFVEGMCGVLLLSCIWPKLNLFLWKASSVPPTSSKGFLQVLDTIEVTYPILAGYSGIFTKKGSLITAPPVLSELGSWDELGQFIIMPSLCSADVLEVSETIFLYYVPVKKASPCIFPRRRASLNKYAKYQFRKWHCTKSLPA